MTPRQMLQILEVFQSHDELMPVQRVATFLYVAMRGRVTRTDVMEDLGQSLPGAYRNLMSLSDAPYVINGRRKQGHGFLTFEEDTNESRRLVWTLTTKGKRLKAQLEEISGGAKHVA